MQTLKKRSDFLRAARAGRHVAASMLVQGRARDDGDPAVRVGFTCSKKVGNAVARNRAKRRLRAVAREVLPGMARPGWDYVLIGRPDVTVKCPYDRLRADLALALKRLHQKRK
ncbi:ribonuclease P protein component [Roseovarius sp. SYSU LYC5161]|uniref:ribonuclease P protein component n=1 Tax=Roseovarius halophilus (ex Wu et al. 2025) TaxID=3376060 RepID=UPI00399C013E